MNTKPQLLWAAYPLAICVVVFGLIATVNWGYESKFFDIRSNVTDWAGQHTGLIMLTMAIVMASVASLILLVAALFWPKSRTGWFMVPVTIATVLFVFPSLFVIILGPAAITMIEQTNSASK